MGSRRRFMSAAALFATVTISIVATPSFVGAVGVGRKIGVASGADRVDHRPCPHRRHHWRARWHYGWVQPLGTCAGIAAQAESEAYPAGCGFFIPIYPTSGWGAYPRCGYIPSF